MLRELLVFGAQINAALEGWRHPALTFLFRVIAFLGDAQGYMLAVPLVCWLASLRRGTLLCFGVLVSSLLNTVIKETVRLDRPFLSFDLHPLEAPHSYSFPSGHSQLTAFFWIYACLLFPSRGLRYVALPVILLTGFSRLYLGAHYISDVIVGWVLGALSAWLFYRERTRIDAILGGLGSWSRFAWAALPFLAISFAVPHGFLFYCVAGILGLFLALRLNPIFRTPRETPPPRAPGKVALCYLGVFAVLASYLVFKQDLARIGTFFVFALWIVWIVPLKILRMPTAA